MSNSGHGHPGRAHQKAKRIAANEFLPYLDAGLDLFPLRRPRALTKDGKPAGKLPQHKGWRDRQYAAADVVRTCAVEGRNVGVRLGPDWLVIDVDPRNDGAMSFRRLCSAFGLEPAGCPRVITGSGGDHYYLRKPRDLCTRAVLAEYPGVDFKTAGGFVVAAGSVHPNGKRYVWDFLEPVALACAPTAPERLLLALARPKSSGEGTAGVYSPREIAAALARLDPTAFANNAAWEPLMMACHDASGGAAEDEFVAWSISDAVYADQEETIRTRWASCSTDPGRQRRTYKTLLKILVDHGAADALAAPNAAEDFEDEPVNVNQDGVLAEAWKPSVKDPYKAAQEFHKQKHPSLIHQNGDWLEYCGSNYVAVDEGSLRAELYDFLGSGFRPNQAAVANALDALRAVSHVPRDKFDPPCWLDGEGPFPAAETLAFTNGLLHLPSGRFIAPTSNFFTRNALDYTFDPHTPKPREWRRFLLGVFQGSRKSIGLLQEIFGYLLLPDTKYQKAFLWDSPPRGGKGTTLRIAERMIGRANCCSPTLAGIGKDAILTSMIGKQLAIVSDMRIDQHTNLGVVAENLLRITGEDSVTFDRKYIAAWTGRLAVRFFILTNLPPNIPDVSGALSNRFVPLVSFESFLGREEDRLEERLLAELPGILLWAIAGWRRLNARRRFKQTPEGQALLDRMIEATSPVRSFLREACVVEPDAKVAKSELFEAWEAWQIDKAHIRSMSEAVFARNLYSAAQGKIRETRLRNGGERQQALAGVRLRDGLDF